MCHPTSCKTCGKTTWAGCGLHVAHIRARIPANQWCAGHPRSERTGGWLGRFLGR